MYVKTKVAVICQGADDPEVYRLALAVTARAWDAGAEVRIRLVGEVIPPDDARSSPQWVEILCDSDGIPQASSEDLEWADVVLFGTPTRDGAILGSLKRFIDSAVPLRKDGKLANKVYGVFTGATTRRDGTATRLLSLADVFDLWGGTVVTPGGGARGAREEHDEEARQDYDGEPASDRERVGGEADDAPMNQPPRGRTGAPARARTACGQFVSRVSKFR